MGRRIDNEKANRMGLVPKPAVLPPHRYKKRCSERQQAAIERLGGRPRASMSASDASLLIDRLLRERGGWPRRVGRGAAKPR